MNPNPSSDLVIQGCHSCAVCELSVFKDCPEGCNAGFCMTHYITHMEGDHGRKMHVTLENPAIGCSIDRPLRARPITDADLTAASDRSYNLGRRHGKEEMLDERETLIYWLLRCYQSGHREGWEKGPTTQETMDALLHVLAERGYDPNLDSAAKELIARIEKV